MKKSFLIIILIFALISFNSVNAQNNFEETYFQEYTFDNVLVSDIGFVKDNQIESELTLKTNEPQNVKKKKKRRLFSFLNPIRPVKIVNKTIDISAGYLDGIIDSKLKKLDKTPLYGIEKTDEIIDSGVEHLDRVFAKGTDYLDKIADAGLGKIDDVLFAGVDKTAVQQWLNADYAARKCFGMRPLLESHGVTIDSSFLYSPFTKTRGGANDDRSTKGYSLFILGVTLDTEQAKMWKGGKLFTLYQRKTGYGLSGENGAMGDYFGFDGWDMAQINQISEFWYQQKFFGDKLRMKFGKQDSNTDFGYLNSGWDFMNSGFSVNPATPLPTCPYPPFGFMAEVNPNKWLSVRDGIYSKGGNPFNITEIELKPIIKKKPGRYMLGFWEFSDSNGMGVATGVESDNTIYNNFYRNYGGYIGFEQMIHKEQINNDNDMQGLVAFGQFGVTPSNKNDMDRYMSFGLHYKGLIPHKNNDIAGIAVGSGNFATRLSNMSYDNGGRVGSETVVEAFYRFYVNRWFYLQPDVQFIMNPGGAHDKSVAVGIRSVITF